MPSEKINEFAALLVREIRDPVIRDLDMCRRSENQSITAKRWRKAKTDDAGDYVEMVIPDCVDETLFFLLRAIDEGLIRLQFIAADGTVVDLTREGLGELAGWYSGPGGFCMSYSEQRVNDFAENDSD